MNAGQDIAHGDRRSHGVVIEQRGLLAAVILATAAPLTASGDQGQLWDFMP